MVFALLFRSTSNAKDHELCQFAVKVSFVIFKEKVAIKYTPVTISAIPSRHPRYLLEQCVPT